MSEVSAPSKAFHRIRPLLVAVEITDKPWRLLLTRITGAWPCGEQLQPRTSSLRRRIGAKLGFGPPDSKTGAP